MNNDFYKAKSKKLLQARIDGDILKKVQKFCKDNKIFFNKFVQAALEEFMEKRD